MLKFGNTFVNVGGTYLTGHTKYIPPADWREVFHTYSAGDSYSYGNTNNESLFDGNFSAPYASAYTQIDTTSTSHHIFEGTGPDASASTNYMGNITFEEPEKIKYLLIHGEWSFQDVGGHWGNVNNLTNALKTNQQNAYWYFGVELGGLAYAMHTIPDRFTDQKVASISNGRYYCYEGSKRYYFNGNELTPWYEINGSHALGWYQWTPNIYNMLIKLGQDSFSVSCYSNLCHVWSAWLDDYNTAISPAGLTATTSTLDNPRIFFSAGNCGNHNGSDYWSYCSYITPNFGVSACYSDELNLEQLYRLTNKDYIH